MYSSRQKGMRKVRDQGLEAGLYKIIQTTPDDLSPREAQELAGAEASLPVVAGVVSDQYGRSRLVDNRAK